jgi:hypothetical protein
MLTQLEPLHNSCVILSAEFSGVQPVAVAHPSHQDDICAVPALSPFTFETTTNHARLAGTV